MNFIEEKILDKGNLDRLTLRFPPEPNGHLHAGHAKSIILNFGLAEKYNRPCNLRFDDTNPITEDKHYVESIIEDIKWLGYNPSNIFYTSDYFDFLYSCAIILIKKGLAYVDDSTSEEIANLKGTPTIPGKDSPYKSRTIEENLDLFNRMRLGEFVEGSKILRANIDMTSPNMILRDPVLYRIISTPHHRTGDTWKIYPMYDFAHPLSDYKEGITDSLCTLEFEVHRPLYMWVLENCDLENPLPEETEFARLNLDYTVMSKRKLKRLVEEGFVDGWNDPRMPTISGLRRRGFTPESIKEFCDRISVTRKESVVSYLLLEECLRVDLNKRSNRLMGVMKPIKLTIINWDNGTEWVEVENNSEDSNAGTRMVPFGGKLWIESEDFCINPDKKYNRLKPDGEVRLKGGYVVKATDYIIDESGNVIEVKCTYDPLSKSGMTLDRKIKGTIHWVSAEHGINVEVRDYDRLFTESNPDDLGDFTSCLNKESLIINKDAIFEPSVINCNVGNPVQMMRKGYYVLDSDSTPDELVFNKTVSLKESYK
jgi:glutaminyl-tRNA synthetase